MFKKIVLSNKKISNKNNINKHLKEIKYFLFINTLMLCYFIFIDTYPRNKQRISVSVSVSKFDRTPTVFSAGNPQIMYF
jgi:hypothetical protein